MALEQFNNASATESRTGNVAYNLGLGYFEAKEYDKALIAAHEAYADGFNFPGLKNKLEKAGKWRNPVIQPSTKADQPEAPPNGTPVEEKQ